MYYNVIDAEHVRDHTIWLKFEDGTEGEVDLSGEFAVAEYGTIAWPNGADLAPEFLYARTHVSV